MVLLEGPPGAGVARERVLVLRGPVELAVAVPGPPGPPVPASGPAPRRRGRGRLPDGTRWWLLPHDPALPGLDLALDHERLDAWLPGLGRAGEPAWVAYRPGERAVLRVPLDAVPARPDEPGSSLHLKVLPPARLHGMHGRLLAARAAGLPVPPPLAPPDLGVLALGTLPGEPWRARLGADAPQPAPAAVAALLDALPDALAAHDDGPSRTPAWSALLAHAVRAGTLLDPGAAEELRERARRLEESLAAADPGPRVPVHGDLHPDNLLLAPGTDRIVGVLDPDSLGPGHRVDDWAVLVGHLAVAAADAAVPGPSHDPERARRTAALAAEFTGHACGVVDEEALRARADVTALALAAAPDLPAAVRAARRSAR